MEIVFLGQSSFRLKGKSATVVTDPYGELVGKYPKDVEADIVLVSHQHEDHNQVAAIKGQPFVIDGPGEYEMKDVSVIGIHSWHDSEQGAKRGVNTIYVIEADGLRIAHLGDLGHKLSDDQLSEMGPIDIVMVPVGGEYTIDHKQAAEVVKQVDPWIVIPMHYGHEKLKLAPVSDFLKEMGVPETPSEAKLVITAERLPTEMKVIVLEKK